MAVKKHSADADTLHQPGERSRFIMLVNPRAGGGDKLPRQVRAHLEGCGCHVRELEAKTPEELNAHVAATGQAEADAIIIAGGDGTLRTALQAQQRHNPPLALLPCGTANVIARDIGLPRRARALARICRQGPVRPVHGGLVNDTLFLMSVGAGFDARAVATVNPALKRCAGRLAYLAAAIALLRHWPDEGPYRIAIDGGPEEEAASAIVLNTRLYGGGFMIDPDGGMDRPGLRAILFHGGRRRDLLRYVLAGLSGRLRHLKDVSFRQARNIRIVSPRQHDICQIDGDPGPACPLTVTACTGAGRMIVPR